MNWVRRSSAHLVVIYLGLAVSTGSPVMALTGWAKEIAFVARDVEDQQAVWLPGEIIIHRSTDFREPLIFRFDNPTVRTHVFEAPGLFESVEENGLQIARPVRITIPPEGTEQSVIDRNRMASDAIAVGGGTVTYRFYCPLHRADADLGGRIVVGQ
ncbi:MAG: hypothetical protein WBK08_02685 [Nitrospira sp.]|jgi:hypothetical protein|nr:MAG: hypothetical protein E8D42_00955 [Nitrospira sp.]